MGTIWLRERLAKILFWLHGFVLLIVIALAVYGIARGQASAVRTNASDKPATPVSTSTNAAPDRAKFDELRKAGAVALLNLDYEEAQRKFKEMVHEFPDHPAGTQFLAASLWLKTLNQSRRLQSGLYNSESFYAKNEDKVDPALVAQFRELTRTAKQLAEARLKQNPRDTEALYFLGLTQGLKASFEAAVERRFIAALRDGSDAVDKHRALLKLDPGYTDARLTIGMYDYILGGLPFPIRVVAGLTGNHGSKKRGLATLELVAREGTWARDDAKVLLIPLYKRERRFADALKITRELAADYPRNYLFKLETADALVSQAAVERQANNVTAAATDEREAFAIFDALLHERNTDTHQLDLIHYQYGSALFTAGQMEHAAQEFLAAAAVPGAEGSQATMARLRAAQALDLAGKRKDAVTQYQAVLARPNVYDSQDEARRGLREPYHVKTEEKKQDEEN
jgi:tetratricopeptide (TPR) repeat protein